MPIGKPEIVENRMYDVLDVTHLGASDGSQLAMYQAFCDMHQFYFMDGFPACLCILPTTLSGIICFFALFYFPLLLCFCFYAVVGASSKYFPVQNITYSSTGLVTIA